MGSNVITVEVTAEDTTTTRTYTVTVTRADPFSTDARLKLLVLDGYEFSIRPLDADAAYGRSIDYSHTEATITATTNHEAASYVVKVDGVVVDDGVISLVQGNNPFTVVVTAEDGTTTKTYRGFVDRMPPSDDAKLSALTLSGVSIGTFASDTLSYTASVVHSVSQTTVTPTLNDTDASYVIKLGGVEDVDGTVSLSVGTNVITVEVTAEDGRTTKTYTVTVTRSEQCEGEGLTADILDQPKTHDGETPFTFELCFTQEPARGLGFRVIRDHLFEVTEGTIDGVGRKERGSSRRWRVTVEPAGDADVVIVQKPTKSNCESWRAVCTPDGTKLSGSESFTVDGPASQQPVNSVATGDPGIDGTLRVGSTLTANTSNIADADGMTNAVFTYQWKRIDPNSAETEAERTSPGPPPRPTSSPPTTWTRPSGWSSPSPTMRTTWSPVPSASPLTDTRRT